MDDHHTSKKAKGDPVVDDTAVRMALLSASRDIRQLRDVPYPSWDSVNICVQSLSEAIEDAISTTILPDDLKDSILTLQDLDQLIGNQLRCVDGGFMDLRNELSKATHEIKQYLDMMSDGSPSGGFSNVLFNAKVRVLDVLVKEAEERQRMTSDGAKRTRNTNMAALELKHLVKFLRKDGSHSGNVYDDDFQEWKKEQVKELKYPDADVIFHWL